MADLTICGMEMPKENDILVFDVWKGKVYARSTANTGTRRYEVVPIPAGHGRLIDADALCRFIANNNRIDGIIAAGIISYINAAHTIVPAEGGIGNGNSFISC